MTTSASGCGTPCGRRACRRRTSCWPSSWIAERPWMAVRSPSLHFWWRSPRSTPSPAASRSRTRSSSSSAGWRSAWCRGCPQVELDPELVLFVFLPPLLYSAAFFADLPALRRDIRSLSLTSIGLVLLTVVVVAVVGHAFLGLTWAMAFALGAIVSPTDPLAATTIMRRLGVQRRIVNLVEGESLINDAAALVSLPRRRRGGGRRNLLAGRGDVRVRGGHRGRRRRRPRRRLAGPAGPRAHRRSADEHHRQPADRLRRLRACGGGARVGCPRRRDCWGLPRVALARAGLRRRAVAGDGRLGGADVPPQRHAVHPGRAATPGRDRRPRRSVAAAAGASMRC